MERTITESLALYLAQHKETGPPTARRGKRAPGIWNFIPKPNVTGTRQFLFGAPDAENTINNSN